MNDHILHKLIDLNFTLNCLKTEYLEYIHDKEYPISSRWDVYCTAPSDMKVHKFYIMNFRSLPEDFIGYDMPLHAERRETIEVRYLLEQIEGWNSRKNCKFLIDIDALKEEILETNIKSFVFDW